MTLMPTTRPGGEVLTMRNATGGEARVVRPPANAPRCKVSTRPHACCGEGEAPSACDGRPLNAQRPPARADGSRPLSVDKNAIVARKMLNHELKTIMNFERYLSLACGGVLRADGLATRYFKYLSNSALDRGSPPHGAPPSWSLSPTAPCPPTGLGRCMYTPWYTLCIWGLDHGSRHFKLSPTPRPNFKFIAVPSPTQRVLQLWSNRPARSLLDVGSLFWSRKWPSEASNHNRTKSMRGLDEGCALSGAWKHLLTWGAARQKRRILPKTRS